MDRKKIIIYGGGAVGSVLAAALSELPQLNLTLVARQAHVEKIKQQGLVLTGTSRNTYSFQCSESVGQDLRDCLLIVTVKATALHDSLEELTPYVSGSTKILFLQNGLGIKDLVTKKWAGQSWSDNIYYGIVAFGATFLKPGRVQFFSGKLVVEENFGKSGYYHHFEDCFLRVHLSGQFQTRVWKKAIINSIFNPLSVLLRVRNGVITREELDPVKQALLTEGTLVARTQGIDPGIDLDQINSFPTTENMTSMLQDFLKGKPTEIDFINGAISLVGKKNKIKTPVNDLLVNLIKALEQIQKYDRFVELDEKKIN